MACHFERSYRYPWKERFWSRDAAVAGVSPQQHSGNNAATLLRNADSFPLDMKEGTDLFRQSNNVHSIRCDLVF